MELIKAIAISIREHCPDGKWPEEATEVTQTGWCTLEFDADFKLTYGGDIYEDCYLEDQEHLPYLSEWDSGETITREEYEEWLAANPNWYEIMMEKRKINMVKIAELNKQVGNMIDEITALAEEACLEINIDLGQHGSLDPNSSDWLESRC